MARDRDAPQEKSYTAHLPTAKQASPRASFDISLTSNGTKPGDVVILTVKATIQPGWHLSPEGAEDDDSPSLPTSIEFIGHGLAPRGKVFVPSVEPKSVRIGDVTHLQHSGTVTWTREYQIVESADGYSGTGSIHFQVCNEETCLPPNRLAFTLGASSALNAPSTGLAKRVVKPIGQPLLIPLTASALERSLINTSHLMTADPAKDFDKYVEQLMFAMRQTEALPLGGTVEIDGESVRLYIADQERYSLENTSTDETKFGNTSTFISIDHNGDGEIVEYESVACNLPIRLFDSMFLVTSISKERREITLQQVDVPLSGAVLGRRCPEFWYETVDGQIVSNKSILGTVTILDIWAVT